MEYKLLNLRSHKLRLKMIKIFKIITSLTNNSKNSIYEILKWKIIINLEIKHQYLIN